MGPTPSGPIPELGGIVLSSSKVSFNPKDRLCNNNDV